MGLVIVSSAVDSLYFSFKGEVDRSFYEYLRAVKFEAKESGEEVPFSIGEEELLMKQHGAGGFLYYARGRNFIVKMSPSLKIPNFYFQALAISLYANGHQKVFEMAKGLIKAINLDVDSKISRIDLCVDIQGWELEEKRLDDFARRANFSAVYRDGRNLNGIQFGRGDVVARIYNKTKEVGVSNKDHMYAIWRENPLFDEESVVWRVEFQFKRVILREFGIDSVEDAFGQLAGLWNYGVNEWLTLRTGNASRVERRPIDNDWQMLNDVEFEGKVNNRVRRTKALSSYERNISMLAGYLSSQGAVSGLDDLETLMRHVYREVKIFYEDNETSFELEVDKKRALMKDEHF